MEHWKFSMYFEKTVVLSGKKKKINHTVNL